MQASPGCPEGRMWPERWTNVASSASAETLVSCAVLDIRVWTGGEGTLKTCQLACLRLCPLLSLQQVHRPVQATVGRDELGLMTFLDSSLSHTHTLELYWRDAWPSSETVSLFPSLFCTCCLMSAWGKVLFWYAVTEEFPILPFEACCVVLQLLLGGGRSVLQVA